MRQESWISACYWTAEANRCPPSQATTASTVHHPTLIFWLTSLTRHIQSLKESITSLCTAAQHSTSALQKSALRQEASLLPQETWESAAKTGSSLQRTSCKQHRPW